jgi:hypothetical protein
MMLRLTGWKEKKFRLKLDTKPSLFGAELLAQAHLVVWTNLVLADFAGFLVQFAAFRVGSFAAIRRWHFLLDTLTEGRALLALAFLIYHLACFALLRVGRFSTIEILVLIHHALLARRAGFVLASFLRLEASVAMCRTGFRVGGLRTITRSTGAGAFLSHAGATLLHSRTHATSHARAGLSHSRKANERSDQCATYHH